MKYFKKLIHVCATVCTWISLHAQTTIIQKEFGEIHDTNIKGGQEKFYTICQLPDGRMLAGGSKVPACRVITEKVPGSFWEKVVRNCPSDVTRQYLAYLDTSANLIREKYWQADYLNGAIKAIKILSAGYVTVAERSDFDTEGFIVSLFDWKDSLVSQKIIVFDRLDFGKNIEQVAVTKQNQIIVQAAEISSGYASEHKEWLFDTNLNLLSVKTAPEIRLPTNNLTQKFLRAPSPDRSRIGIEIQLADKSKISFVTAGTFTRYTIEITHTKLQSKPVILLNEPYVVGKALFTDKWGNVWFVGTKTNNDFDHNAWIARLKRK